MIRGRTNTSGEVEFVDDADGTIVFTIASDTAAQLLTSTAPAVNNATTFADLTAATTAHNALLAALRTRGVITGS